MTLGELIDVTEDDLLISEGYECPIIALKGLDCYSSVEYKGVLAPEMLDRNVDNIKAGDRFIKVYLEVLER